MNKAVIRLLAIVTLSMLGLIIYFFSNSGENITEAPDNKEILEAVEFSPEILKNKGVLFVKEDRVYEDIENTLKGFVDNYNVPIVKVVFTEEVKDFFDSQEKIISDNYSTVADISEKMMTNEEGDIVFSEELNDLLMNTLARLDSGEDFKDVEDNIKKITKNYNVSKEEVVKYLEARLKIAEVVIERPLFKETAPTLVLFNENGEFDRIDALEQDREVLTWLLVNKGIINLTKDKQVEDTISAIENEEELIVSFGTSRCPYCGNTSPLVEKVAKEKGISYYYVDIEAFSNEEKLDELVDKYLNSEIQNTPTVVHIVNKKEVSRFVGQQDELSIEKFIRDSQEMSSSEEKLEEDNKSSDNEELKDIEGKDNVDKQNKEKETVEQDKK